MTFEYEKPICKKGALLKTRCVCKYKTEVKKNKKTLKLSQKIKKIKTMKIRKRCPNKTRRNKKIGKCESLHSPSPHSPSPHSPTYSPTTPTMLTLKDNTPKELKDLRKSIYKEAKSKIPQDPHSFSPNVNKVITSLKSISPHREVGLDICDDNKIYIESDKKGKCYGLKSKIAQTHMLDNLLSKKPINCSSIIAPKQYLSNCWFNAFFMVFFISDKGRKYFRYLRMAMITGKLPNNQTVNAKLRTPLLLLNKYIESSLIGWDSQAKKISSLEKIAGLMDTNEVIRKVARALGQERVKYNIKTIKKASNPFTFYLGLITYLNSNPLSFIKIRITQATSKKKITSELKNTITNHPASDHRGPPGPLDFFIIDRFNDMYPLNSWKIPNKIEIVDKGVKYTYQLDSAVLRDTKEKHFSAYITCNKKQFAFDGESFARLTPFKWKKKLNKNKQWRFAEQHETYFNFQKGYVMLFYYRV
jgi:hypothetical protein